VFYVFVFQAEGGIRDRDVTGVQTCALPIWPSGSSVIFLVEEAAGFFGLVAMA